MPFVYILRCADNTFYVGHTEDLASREALHNSGAGANYTARRRPVVLVYSEVFASPEAALSRERQLKRWSAKKKQALIAGDLADGRCSVLNSFLITRLDMTIRLREQNAG